ncbi:OmpH family outer membrane protein [Amorphoplanes digitatis]|uniref:Uncharacterized protein n=1 Tax=Actinoplanes digitatis TaxID=1868 RepID=A0A7W7HSW4_9ACTN|nr:OmpH family outer membrane protein [Actinoplanes digitatis]MBB4760195.1 hypothetical protein [Actinoplanes digitatis]BFE68270.1 hypothetical protein GCM10020092_015710 [Actinoplanes digitatis]GID94793.1 hypothetical protein Adi01nite_42050 [Actinoplanes digitatis]
MTTRDRDYQLMMSALADVARRRDEELENAEQAYQTSSAQAAGELARAENDAIAADRWAGAAAAQVLDVDREAARLWDGLRRARGMRVRTLGEMPEPAAIETLPRVALESSPDAGGPAPAPRQSARTLLARTAERIDVTVRPAARRPVPRWVLPLLPVLGALIAGACGLVAAGLVTFGGSGIPGGAVLRGLGWLAFLMAPSAGVPVAAAIAHRRLNARLDVGGIGLTLLGGMLAATLLSVTFAGTR